MGSSAEKNEGGGGVSQKKRSMVTGSGDSRECSSSSEEEGRITKEDSECPSLSRTLLGWPIMQDELSAIRNSVPSLKAVVTSAKEVEHRDEVKLKKLGSKLSEMDMMKERFAKLLLGGNMSGSGKGVCTALAISNAITNLCATIFGQLWRLEPLPDERKATSSNWFPLPRHVLMEKEFWHVNQGIVESDTDEGSASFRKTVQRQEKWWLPVPRVPTGGPSENSRKQLNYAHESTCQILKAVIAINSITLSEMEVPDAYLDTLPKHGRDSLGDVIYRYVKSDRFSADCLLDCLDLSSEHVALVIANCVEASIYIWHRRAHSHSRPPPHLNQSALKPSWGTMVKDLMVNIDKRELLAEKSERLLLSLKQWFPGLSQTILDATKIQFNTDVGKSIIENYSRVLESLAFNIVDPIDDILYVDDLTRHSDNLSPSPTVNLIVQRKSCFPYSVPVSGTPYGSTFSPPSFSPSPASFISPARCDRTPFILNNINLQRRGFGVRRSAEQLPRHGTEAEVEQ